MVKRIIVAVLLALVLGKTMAIWSGSACQYLTPDNNWFLWWWNDCGKDAGGGGGSGAS